jgi:NAD(P)H-dependent flavin oxidoreductase YrpB (nitropropane dioxygenase family)
MHPALHTRLCELAGVRYPIVQTGMGWVASAKLVSATANAGGLGIIASATMDLRQLADAIARDEAPHRSPVRREPALRRADVMERAELMVKRGVRVASFALAPSETLMKSLKDQGLGLIPSIGAKRHAEKVAAGAPTR